MITITECNSLSKHISIMDTGKIDKINGILILEGIDNKQNVYNISISDYTLEQIFKILIKKGMHMV